MCLTLYQAPRNAPLSYHADYLKNGAACDLDMPRLAVYAAVYAWQVTGPLRSPHGSWPAAAAAAAAAAAFTRPHCFKGASHHQCPTDRIQSTPCVYSVYTCTVEPFAF